MPNRRDPEGGSRGGFSLDGQLRYLMDFTSEAWLLVIGWHSENSLFQKNFLVDTESPHL
jgi:hypothetical protein